MLTFLHRIRQSTPTWNQSFVTSLEKIRTSLFIINPTILGIHEAWNKFKDVRLFDIEAILTKGGSFELRNFKTMMTQKLEKAHEKLMTRFLYEKNILK